jgi:hypothetical protein
MVMVTAHLHVLDKRLMLARVGEKRGPMSLISLRNWGWAVQKTDTMM